MYFRIFAFAILFCLLPFAVQAEKKTPAAKAEAEALVEQGDAPLVKSEEKKDLKPVAENEWAPDIQKAQDYLNNLKTARARFVQTTNDGTQLVGTFYIDRPGKLRFEYDEPIDDFVVADGFFIYFYDAELKEQTNAPIGQTLADFFLRAKLSFSDDLTVKNVKRGGDYLQIEITQTADPAAGSLTLGFTEEPFGLKKWRIVDAQGLITEVELFYLKTDIKHPADLFVYVDPQTGKRPYNQ